MTRDLPLLFLFPKISQSIACEHSLHTGCTPRTKKVNKIKGFLALCPTTGTKKQRVPPRYPLLFGLIQGLEAALKNRNSVAVLAAGFCGALTRATHFTRTEMALCITAKRVII